ncbi:MAG: diguanylate cyclase [Gammaproteobacteria bacterium]|nr:diguanylate cyclase [Gammaproteobacteria bacterium]
MKQILINKIANMTEEDLVENMYRDPTTKVWNRRAFDQTPDSKFVALIDLDSLKWINDNHGHRAGDRMLYKLAQQLDSIFPDNVFRVSGDEFVVRSNDLRKLTALNANRRCFSFGIGQNLVDADARLRADKVRRENSGHRAPRGERAAYLKPENGLAAVESGYTTV